MWRRDSRIVLVLALAACGGAKPAPAPAPPEPKRETAPAETPPPTDPSATGGLVGPAELANTPPAPPPPKPTPPKPTPPMHDRLLDRDGKIAGLAGFSIKRKASKIHCGGFQIVTTHGKKVSADDAPLVAVFKLEFPKNLSFDLDPKHAKKKDESKQRFAAFIDELTTTGGKTYKHYEAKLAGADEPVKVATAARMAQVFGRLASVLARAEIPVEVRSGDSAEDKIKIYCDTLAEKAELFQAKAEEAIAICAEKAKGVGAGWWNEVCVAP